MPAMAAATPEAAAAAPTLEAAGLAKVTIVYVDEHGHHRTLVHTMTREDLNEELARVSEKAVG